MKLLVTFVILMMTLHTQTWGQETWVKTFGGSHEEMGESVVETADGGYVITGWTSSNDGDFIGMNKGEDNGTVDIFVTKIDKQGVIEWTKTFGGSNDDVGFSIIVNGDGSFTLAGYTSSTDGDFAGLGKGGNDIFVANLTHNGDVIWIAVYGGSNHDKAISIAGSEDHGYVLTGHTSSNDGDFTGSNKGGLDAFVLYIDRIGRILWTNTFGGTGTEYGLSIASTHDNCFIITGKTSSNDGDFNMLNRGWYDIFVIKLAASGEVLWKKTYGGTNGEDAFSIVATQDEGMFITGRTWSRNGDFNANAGYSDAYLINMDNTGSLRWINTLAGRGSDEAVSITTVNGNGVTVAGVSTSDDGDFANMNKGLVDIFLAKYDNQGNLLWKRMYGGSSSEMVSCVITSRSGGYVLTGQTTSNDGDFVRANMRTGFVLVVKLDSNGYLSPSTSVTDHDDIGSFLAISPNPLSPLSTISYTLDNPSHVRIEVVNSIGEVVSVLSDKQVDVGSHQVPFNTTHLVTGTYTVRLVDIQNNRVSSKRVIHIR